MSTTPAAVATPTLKPDKPIMGDLVQTGRDDWSAWTGGKPEPTWTALDPLARQVYESPNQLRSLNVKAAQGSYNHRKTGLPEEQRYKLGDNVKTFCNLILKKMIDMGMDTISYLPSPQDANVMLNVIEDYPRFTVDTASTCVATQLPLYDQYDRTNNTASCEFLLNSLDKTLSQDITKKIDSTESFPVVWMTFIQEIQSLSSSRYDFIKERLKKRKPTDYAGQDIKKLVSDLRDDAVELDNAGQYDHNLTQTMLDIIFKASADENYFHPFRKFKDDLAPLLLQVAYKDKAVANLEMEKAGLTYTKLLRLAETEYKEQLEKGQWLPARDVRDTKGVPAHYGANLAKLAPLTQPQVMALIQSYTSGNKQNDKCNNCGEKGHWRRDCPKLKPAARSNSGGSNAARTFGPKRNVGRGTQRDRKNPRFVPPGPGEPSTKTLPGKTTPIHWCAKCKRWTTTHGTDSHTGGKQDGPSANFCHIQDPSAWYAEFPTTSSHLFSTALDDLVRLLPVLSLSGLLVGLVVVSILHRMTIYTYLLPAYEIFQSLWVVSAPILWLSLFVVLWFHNPTDAYFDGSPIADGRSRRQRRSDANSYRRHTKHRTYLASIRTHHLHRRYPRRLRSQSLYYLKAPTLSQQTLRSDLASLHTLIIRALAYVRRHHHPTTAREGETRWNQAHHHRRPQPGYTAFHTPIHSMPKGRRRRHCISRHHARRHSQEREHSDPDASYHPIVVSHAIPPLYRRRRRASGCSTRRPSQDNRPVVGYRGQGNLHWTHEQEQAARKIATHVQMAAMCSAEISNTNPALLRMALLAPTKLRNAMPKEATFPVIWDSGASISISPTKSEFVGPYKPAPLSLKLKGIARGVQVEGKGHVLWAFHDTNGMLRLIKVPAYHVPKARARLLSTTSLLQTYPNEKIITTEHSMTLTGEPSQPTRGSVVAHVNPSNNLPMMIAYRYDATEHAIAALHSVITTVNASNMNLSAAEKELLRWHQRLGHIGFRSVQFLMRAGILGHSAETRRLHTAASKITHPPKCAACQYGKQTRRPVPGKVSSVVQDRVGALKHGDLVPGQQVSVDHFICSTKGRLFSGQGKSKEDDKYKGGAIFVDHASSFIHIEFQTHLTMHATLDAKEKFENMCRDNGVVPQSYLTDNGSAFTSAGFNDQLKAFEQIIRFAGAGAHHHNGNAERAIQTIMSIARTMMLHSAIHWPDVSDPTLWPMAVAHAVFLHNHIPNLESGLSPADVFKKTRWEQRKFLDLHVWGCPVYVLDKALSDGKSLPRWKPRSNRHMHMGLSPKHATTSPSLLNPETGFITSQFNVVFDDWFATVTSDPEALPDFNTDAWIKLFGDSTYQYVLDESRAHDEQAPQEPMPVDIQRRHDSVARAIDLRSPATTLGVPPPPTTGLEVEYEDEPLPDMYTPSPTSLGQPPMMPVHQQHHRPSIQQREPSSFQRELFSHSARSSTSLEARGNPGASSPPTETKPDTSYRSAHIVATSVRNTFSITPIGRKTH